MFLASWACVCSATDSGSGLRTAGSGALSRPSVLTARRSLLRGCGTLSQQEGGRKATGGEWQCEWHQGCHLALGAGAGNGARERRARALHLCAPWPGSSPTPRWVWVFTGFPAPARSLRTDPTQQVRTKPDCRSAPVGPSRAAPDRPVSPAWVLRCTPPASAEVCKLSLPKGSHTQIKQHKHTMQEGKQYADVTT